MQLTETVFLLLVRLSQRLYSKALRRGGNRKTVRLFEDALALLNVDPGNRVHDWGKERASAFHEHGTMATMYWSSSKPVHAYVCKLGLQLNGARSND